VDELDELLQDLDRSEMVIHVSTETRKFSKPVTIISGLKLSNAEAKSFLSSLKKKLAAGGTWKDGQMMLQGDSQEKVTKFLIERGYKIVY
jgi:translation initiation factor 1